ncbi:MAG: hypothetical protein WAL91_08620 [Propionicimonas sp.]
MRRYAWLSLIISTAIAVVAAFGGVWAARAGILVAIAGGALAAGFAWREVRATRRSLLAQNSADSRRAGDQLHAERVQHVRLIGVLQVRNAELRSKLTTARAENARLTQDAGRLRGDLAAAELELSQQRSAAEAEVFAWPRQLSGHGDVTDLWGVDGAPTVVALQALANPPIDSAPYRQHA